jgi:hypothetical protein
MKMIAEIFFSLFKQVAHSRCTNTYNISTKSEPDEKKALELLSYSFCQ